MKIFKAVYYIICIFIAIIAVLLIVSVFPITGNYKVLTVLSGSMEPTIKIGAVVVIRPENDYKIGDIITFGPNTKTQTPVTHRINDIKVVGGNAIYITKGDANNAPDSKEIKKKDIIGKMLFSVPFAGYAVDFVKKPIGFILIIMVPAVIIVYDEIRKIFKEIKKRKKPEPEQNDN
jgi:signal peptidase